MTTETILTIVITTTDNHCPNRPQLQTGSWSPSESQYMNELLLRYHAQLRIIRVDQLDITLPIQNPNRQQKHIDHEPK